MRAMRLFQHLLEELELQWAQNPNLGEVEEVQVHHQEQHCPEEALVEEVGEPELVVAAVVEEQPLAPFEGEAVAGMPAEVADSFAEVAGSSAEEEVASEEVAAVEVAAEKELFPELEVEVERHPWQHVEEAVEGRLFSEEAKSRL